MIAKKPDWRSDADYEFTKELDRAGWAWEFLRRNNEYRSDYEALIDGQSDMRRKTPHLRTSADVVEHGPDVISAEEALGLKWRMERAVDPDGGRAPQFTSIYPKELGWDDVRGFFGTEKDGAPVVTQSPFLVLAFDLSGDADTQVEKTRRILAARADNEKVALRRLRFQWTYYLRLLDADDDVSSKEIIGHVADYQQIENEVETGYKGTDRISDHKKAAKLLRDDPLSIIGKTILTK